MTAFNIRGASGFQSTVISASIKVAGNVEPSTVKDSTCSPISQCYCSYLALDAHID